MLNETECFEMYLDQLQFLNRGFMSLAKNPSRPLDPATGMRCVIKLVNTYVNESKKCDPTVAIDKSFRRIIRYERFSNDELSKAIRMSIEAYKQSKNPDMLRIKIGKIPDMLRIIERRR